MPTNKKTQPKTKKQTKRTTTNELALTRMFDAPRERVWKAWTNPAEVKRWWGPKHFTAPVAEIDLRVGGKYLNAMKAPDGKEYWSTGVFREVVPLKKLVLTDSFADPKGNVVPAAYYGMNSKMPLEMLITVTFEDVDGKTRMTLRHAGLPAGPDRKGANQGWSESFDKLDAYLATQFAVNKGKQQVSMSRVFDAPRKRVFDTYTDPKRIPTWWGPRNQSTEVETMDVRVGGRWRYVSREADGKEFAFRGKYLEIVAPKRLVTTFEFEGMPGHVSQDIATFEDLGRKTKLTVTTQFDSLEDLEGMLASGMEWGARETWERLAELLETR